MTTNNGYHGRFDEALKEVSHLFYTDKLDECVDKGLELLAQPALPRDHKMKLLVLLSGSVGDWEEAECYRLEAEGIWHIIRAWHPEHDDPEMDRFMASIRRGLDECKAALREEEDEDIECETEDNEFMADDETPFSDVEGFDSDDEISGEMAKTRDGDLDTRDGDLDTGSEATLPVSELEVRTPAGSTEKYSNRKPLALHIKERPNSPQDIAVVLH